MINTPPVVVISGASSGIGASLAHALARSQAARLGLLARRTDQLEVVAAEVRALGGEALVLPCDVVDPEQVQQAVDQCVEAFGPIDLAVANAGIGDGMPARKIDAELIQRVMRINYEGSANLFAAVVPAMLERGQGHIAGVSSIAGYRGLPSSGPYSASKAALSTLLESLRLELPASGVAVTAIHPGFVKTPMTDKNPFWMPFMVPVDKAGRIIERGLRKKKREINFPWPMVLIVRALKWIPDFLYDLVMGSGARRSGLNVP